MHLKRYRRQTVKEALRAVREDLGPDALVLSTRTVTALGVRGLLGAKEVEITAAAERFAMSEDRHALTSERPEMRAGNEIAARLEAGGMDPALAREIAAAHPATRRRGATARHLRATLVAELASLVAGEEGYAPVEVFVGPPGVGKTTTIAKIAAQERARHGKRLALLAADGFRVGAVEQLRMFADIIGSQFTIARSAQELDAALGEARRPLLLDTAGRSPNDEISREMFRVLAGRQGVRTHLVLSAGTPVDAARRTFERFGDARPSRLVLTKLDEVESLGPLVSLIRDRGLPVSYFGTGQNVPEDLQRATPPMLAALVMGENACEGAMA
jgi:flagellar biosynthesis protein FlhF